jgi:hypothetical protein
VTDQVFVIQQIGKRESPERKRADEIYNYIVKPAVMGTGLKPYRADMDLTPGAITPKMLAELLNARLVIADLTGHNPNVFYELGITHSFARPLISIAHSSSDLPFDAKDQRIIEIGEYLPSGLTYPQGEEAKLALQQSLEIVLDPDYTPPSPLREVAANASVDQLAPENPVAAEMAQVRETLEDIKKRLAPRIVHKVPPSVQSDLGALRAVIANKMGSLNDSDFESLVTLETSTEQDEWVKELRTEWQSRKRPVAADDPWAADASSGDGFSDEPPF